MPDKANDLLAARRDKEVLAAMKRMADQRPVQVTTHHSIPENASFYLKNRLIDVNVRNFGDVLKSLSLLGKGVENLCATMEKNGGEKESAQRVLDAIQSLADEVRKQPKKTEVAQTKIEFPRSISVNNIEELQASVDALSEQFEKLADAVGSNGVDMSPVVDAIKGIVFPIPTNPTAAFKNSDMENVSVVLTADGKVPVEAAFTGTVTVALDKANDSVAVWSNTAKDGTGTNYQPIVDTDGHTQVDVLSSALPTGAATSANQTTIIGHLDGVEGLLTTIDADTGTLAGTVSGTEVQVDVVAALPAGTNNIGDVDVATLPTTVHSADYDTGAGTDTTLAFGIAVPANGGAAVVPGDATAGLKVDLGTDNDVTVSSSALPTGAATSAKQDTGNTSLATIAGAVSGTEMQVDVLTMPTTTVQATNLDIRDLASTSDSIAIKNTAGDRSLDVVTGGDTVASKAGLLVWGSDGTNVKAVSTNTSGHVNIADGGNSITVDNAALSVTGGGVEASALRVTLANDSTGVLSVDDNGGSLTVDGTVAVSSISTSVTPGTAAANLGKAEDAAHSSGDVGVMALAVRNDADGSLAGTDGDYAPLQVNDLGALKTVISEISSSTATGTITALDGAVSMIGDGAVVAQISGTWSATLTFEATVDGSNWVAVQGVPSTGTTAVTTTTGNGAWQFAVGGYDEFRVRASLFTSGTVNVSLAAAPAGATKLPVGTSTGGTSFVDDAAFTVATDSGTPAMAIFDNTGTDSVDEGDAGVLRMSANRNLYTQIRDAAGNERGANVNASNELLVALSSVPSHAVTNAGTFAVQESGSALTALQLIDNPIVAHDAAASGSSGVNMAGGYATNSIEGVTQVANADASRIITDLNGVIVTRPHTTLEEIITERVSDTGGTSTAFTNFAAGGAGIHNYVTTIVAHNSSATDGYLDIRDGAAGSVLFTVPLPATGGTAISLPVPLKGSANTALAYDVSAALSTVYISLVGFQAQG